MSDGIMIVQNKDGSFSEYDDTYDIVIHCESEDEREKVIESLKSRMWIPVSERLPEEIDRRYYMCLLENHVEDLPMFCQYSELYGFGFYRDIYDPVTLEFLDTEFDTMEELDYEKVLYWRELLDPPEESDYETD